MHKTITLHITLFRRLRQESSGGAWCPKHQITTESTEWIEIDLRRVHVITGSGTQGRFGNGQGVEFAEAYLLEYWRPALGKWVRYKDVRGEEVRFSFIRSNFFSFQVCLLSRIERYISILYYFALYVGLRGKVLSRLKEEKKCTRILCFVASTSSRVVQVYIISKVR